MGRLIDDDVENSKLLDFITQNDIAIAYAIEHKDRTMLEGIFAEYFEAQRIAYNLEKVVAELVEMRNKDSQGCKDMGRKCLSYSDCGLCIMDRAINKVKAGVIDG